MKNGEIDLREGQSVRYDDFKQRVRSVPLIPMLRGLAALNTESHRLLMLGSRPKASLMPFVLEGIARTALVGCNDHRHGKFTEALVERLGHLFIGIGTPKLDDPSASIDDLIRPLIFEQFPGQLSPRHNIARAQGIFIRRTATDPRAPSEAEWRGALGVSLKQYIGVTFALYATVLALGGCIRLESLQTPDMLHVLGMTAEQLEQLVFRHFSISLPEAQVRAKESETKDWEKWSFNPLQDRPLLILEDGTLLCPSPGLLLDKGSANGIYYLGAKIFGARFTDPLGELFEQYLEEHLALIHGGTVYREIVYKSAGQQMKSCDFIVVLPSLVLLVEAKTARPSLRYRSGEEDREALSRIEGARRQVCRTGALIREGHEDFSHIPANRPLLGLVVTLEPYFLDHLGLDEYTCPDQQLVVRSACAHDVERLGAYFSEVDDPGGLLLKHWETSSITTLLRQIDGLLADPQNPIVQRDFDSALDFPGISAARRNRPTAYSSE